MWLVRAERSKNRLPAIFVRDRRPNTPRTILTGCGTRPWREQPPAHAVSLSQIFYPEDGGDTFLRNVGSHKYSVVLQFSFCAFYNSSALTPRKTYVTCYQEFVFIGLLPSNGCPSIVESVT
jgi:hypothetical protein